MKKDMTSREQANSDDAIAASAGPAWNNQRTRRRFLKQSGGAGAALALSFGVRPQAVLASGSGSPHCSKEGHENCCEYVTAIDVVFAASEATDNEAPNSGDNFTGTLTVTVTRCQDCADTSTRIRSWPVHSGGRLAAGSDVTQGQDTTCPAGDFFVDNREEGTGGSRFGINEPDNELGERTAIQIHGPGISEGCIVFDENYQQFRDEMAHGRSCDCATPAGFGLDGDIPTSVRYQTAGPDGVQGNADDLDPPTGNRGTDEEGNPVDGAEPIPD